MSSTKEFIVINDKRFELLQLPWVSGDGSHVTVEIIADEMPTEPLYRWLMNGEEILLTAVLEPKSGGCWQRRAIVSNIEQAAASGPEIVFQVTFVLLT